jgi:fructuronate reductase
MQTLKGIPLAIAGWARYLLGVDDSGEAMPLSPDPLLPSLEGRFSGTLLGNVKPDLIRPYCPTGLYSAWTSMKRGWA